MYNFNPFNRIEFKFPEEDPVKRERERLLFEIFGNLHTIRELTETQIHVIRNASPDVDVRLLEEYYNKTIAYKKKAVELTNFPYEWNPNENKED